MSFDSLCCGHALLFLCQNFHIYKCVCMWVRGFFLLPSSSYFVRSLFLCLFRTLIFPLLLLVSNTCVRWINEMHKFGFVASLQTLFFNRCECMCVRASVCAPKCIQYLSASALGVCVAWFIRVFSSYWVFSCLPDRCCCASLQSQLKYWNASPKTAHQNQNKSKNWINKIQ